MYQISKADCVATESVARWVADYDVGSAPANARDNLDLVLLDTLGVMLASTRYAVGQSIARGAISLSAGAGAVVPGTDKQVDLTCGALLYGTLGHGIELDEVHLPSRQHVGATTVAAALVLGQHLDCSLTQLREAVLVGYEIAGHLGIAMDNNLLLDRNFHLSGVVSGFGCTSAGARLLGLNEGQIYQALGLTASQASGTLAWHTESHHMSKSLQCGLAARNGVTAAVLAQQGCLGPAAVFAGPCNYFRAFRGDDPNPDWHHGLGKEFEILNSSMKLYAAGRPMHAALDALLEIMKRDTIAASDIAAMEVRMPPGAARIVDGNSTNSIDCRTVMATAAIDGKFGLDEADDARACQTDVQTLKQRIRLVHDTALDSHFPRHFPAQVQVRCHDGRTTQQTVIAATGERDRPMTPHAIAEKFNGLAEPVVGRAAAAQLAELVLSRNNAGVRQLAQLLVAPQHKSAH